MFLLGQTIKKEKQNVTEKQERTDQRKNASMLTQTAGQCYRIT